jgi:FkbM family methyltransferase
MHVLHRDFKWSGVSDDLETKVWTLLRKANLQRIMDVGARNSSMPDIFKDSKVALFEPNQRTAVDLHMHHMDNKNVTIHGYGLGEANTDLTYYDNTESFIKRTVHVQSHSPMMLPIRTFKYAMDELSWNNVDFLKIDTEGYELNILRSAKPWIDDHRIKYIQFEMGGTIFDSNWTMIDIFAVFDSTWRIYNIEYDALNLIDEPFVWSSKDQSNGNFFATWVSEDKLRDIFME